MTETVTDGDAGPRLKSNAPLKRLGQGGSEGERDGREQGSWRMENHVMQLANQTPNGTHHRYRSNASMLRALATHHWVISI